MLQKGIEIYISAWRNPDTFVSNNVVFDYIEDSDLIKIKNNIVSKIESVGLSDNETIYLSPLCKLPRYKIDEFTKTNNMNNIKKCYMFRTAQKVVVNKRQAEKLLDTKRIKFFKIPISDIQAHKLRISVYHFREEKTLNLQSIVSEGVDHVLIRKDTSHTTVGSLDVTSYPIVSAVVCESPNRKEFQFLVDMFTAMDKYKFTISDDDTLLNQMNKELVIDEDIYQSLRNMLSSRDYNNHTVAKELIANSNFKESEVYLLMLLHEFQRSLISGSKTPNYQVFLNRYSQWKTYAKGTDWFNYGLKLIKTFPNDRDKIKGFMITRFNKMAGAEVLTDMIFKH